MLSLLHKPPMPFALIPQMPTNEWQWIISAKAPSQIPSATFAFCQTRSFDNDALEIGGQFLTNDAGKSQARNILGFCWIPLNLEVEGDSLEGNTVFLLLLTHQLFPHVQVAAFLLLSMLRGLEHEQEGARDAHRWQKEIWGRPPHSEELNKEKPPATEKVARAEGRRKELPFRALLMTCGETTQQSFRRSNGRSRRQMFSTYVEN